MNGSSDTLLLDEIAPVGDEMAFTRRRAGSSTSTGGMDRPGHDYAVA
jgi:hypothetical protein